MVVFFHFFSFFITNTSILSVSQGHRLPYFNNEYIFNDSNRPTHLVSVNEIRRDISGIPPLFLWTWMEENQEMRNYRRNAKARFNSKSNNIFFFYKMLWKNIRKKLMRQKWNNSSQNQPYFSFDYSWNISINDYKTGHLFASCTFAKWRDEWRPHQRGIAKILFHLKDLYRWFQIIAMSFWL